MAGAARSIAEQTQSLSLPVRFSAETASELDDAAAWYEDQRPGLGQALIDAVENGRRPLG